VVAPSPTPLPNLSVEESQTGTPEGLSRESSPNSSGWVPAKSMRE
jgi:hypothetical protein